MAYQVPSFLKRSDDSLLFAGDGELIFYVPEIYFDRKIAVINGEYVSILGVLDYAVFDKSGRNSGLKPMQFPTVFLTKPRTIEKQRNVKLTKTSVQQDYRLLRYSKDDIVVVSVHVPKDIANVEDFYRVFLISGRLPTTIPYDKIQEYFIESIELNGSSYGLNWQMFGFVISEAFRSKNDLGTAFRHTHITDMTNYQAISIADLPKYISPYSSITSQNWDDGVIGSIVDPGRSNSPMEKLLMGTPDKGE